jgi:hypothetical protein
MKAEDKVLLASLGMFGMLLLMLDRADARSRRR